MDEVAFGRYRLIAVIGAAAAAAALLITAVVAGCGRPGKTAPTVAPERLSFILLTVQDVNTVMGASRMEPNGPITHATRTSPMTLSNPDCLGAFLNGQTPVYQGSGYTAISAEGLTDPDHVVDQAAVSFPSADLALAFVKTSAGKWRACAGQTITQTDKANGNVFRWTFENLVGDVPAITQLYTGEGGHGYGCQHVLRAVLNMVLDVIACGGQISDQAGRIAEKMAAAATQQAH